MLADRVADVAPPERPEQLVKTAELIASGLPLDLRDQVQHLPSCFQAFDLTPDDILELVHRFSRAWVPRERPLLVVGVRTSGSFMAPLCASFLRARGYGAVRVITLRPDAGGLGTDVASILAAIKTVWSPKGVAILVDLGGAETNSEMAIEMLPEILARQGRHLQCTHRRGRGHGGDRGRGRRKLGAGPRHRRGACAVTSPETRHEKSRMTEENSVQGSAVITHEIGLHARPSVKLTKLAKTFESQIHLRGESAGEGGASWVDAKSIVRVMGLKLREGTTVHFRAAGPDAEAAIDALIGLVKRDFDERPAA